MDGRGRSVHPSHNEGVKNIVSISGTFTCSVKEDCLLHHGTGNGNGEGKERKIVFMSSTISYKS